MPRPSRQTSNESSKKTNDSTEKTQNRWVFITKDDVFKDNSEGEDSHPSVCKLRHPRMDTGVLFLVSGDSRCVCELNVFDEKYHSWFIGETVHSGNQMYFATPIDPLFLVLPYLINSGKNNRFMSLEQIMEDEDFPECEKVLSCTDIEQISQLADSKDIDDDLQVYRYNKDKTLSWLKAKCDVLSEVLEEKQINVSATSSHSSLFIRGKNSSASKESYLHYAFGMICDYLPVDMEEDLRSHLGLPAIEEKPPVDNTVENEPPSKKAKMSGDLKPTDDYSIGVDAKKDKNKSGKQTQAQKKLSKVDKSGMKSISSFFSPKK